MSLLCNETEFAVFNIKNITERYCALVSEEEIVKARQLVPEQELRAQETLIFYKSFLENIGNAFLAKLRNCALNQCFEIPKFNARNLEKKDTRRCREI